MTAADAYLRRRRRARHAELKPEAEEPTKREPLVAQGVRSQAPPLLRITPDDLLRRGRSGTVWQRII
jgi:hypothetical protein